MAADTKLTRATFERLQAELKQLTTEGRVEIARTIETARLLGDLSENADYHAAKDAQGHMEARIRKLEAMLFKAQIVEDVDTADVSTGTVVSLRYEGDADVERYLVGSIEEEQDGVSVVSPDSPLGLALLGHKVGDIVQYEAPGGVLKVEIVAIG
ncbi:MAG TPA: transcription elongation factor GreA [Acidimicrobiales bacterium]|nr:transcription elongation factor GreA [Acidimicrobiales bacterium]